MNKGRLFLSGSPTMLASKVILQHILLPLMRFLRWIYPLFWPQPRLSKDIFELWQTELSPSISLFNQKRRDYSFSFTFWSLTCNSFILVEGRGAAFLCFLRRTPFIGTYFTFLIGTDWYQRKVRNCKFAERVVQRGFFRYHLQLF